MVCFWGKLSLPPNFLWKEDFVEASDRCPLSRTVDTYGHSILQGTRELADSVFRAFGRKRECGGYLKERLKTAGGYERIRIPVT